MSKHKLNPVTYRDSMTYEQLMKKEITVFPLTTYLHIDEDARCRLLLLFCRLFLLLQHVAILGLFQSWVSSQEFGNETNQAALQ